MPSVIFGPIDPGRPRVLRLRCWPGTPVASCRRWRAPRGRTPMPRSRREPGPRRACPQHLKKNLVVHLREFEDAHAVGHSRPAELVAGVQCGLVSARQVAQERGPVVARRGPRQPVIAARSAPHRPAAARSRRRRLLEVGPAPPRGPGRCARVPVSIPSSTMAKATSGWMPTITVSAPRSRAISAMLRSVREPKESRTSSAATSMITPRDRCWPICVDQVLLEPHHLRCRRGRCGSMRSGTGPVAGWRPALVPRPSSPVRHPSCRGSRCSRAAARPPRAHPADRRWCSSCSGRPRW